MLADNEANSQVLLYGQLTTAQLGQPRELVLMAARRKTKKPSNKGAPRPGEPLPRGETIGHCKHTVVAHTSLQHPYSPRNSRNARWLPSSSPRDAHPLRPNCSLDPARLRSHHPLLRLRTCRTRQSYSSTPRPKAHKVGKLDQRPVGVERSGRSLWTNSWRRKRNDASGMAR